MYGEGRHKLNNSFLDFSKGLFIPKLCKPYRAKTKGKVERFNLYIKNNFFKPLRAKIKNTPIDITPELLNACIFSWLEKANNRIHATTNRKPFDMLKEELTYLSKLPNSLFENTRNSVKNDILKKDKIIQNVNQTSHTYYTSLTEYEELLLGESHA